MEIILSPFDEPDWTSAGPPSWLEFKWVEEEVETSEPDCQSGENCTIGWAGAKGCCPGEEAEEESCPCEGA